MFAIQLNPQETSFSIKRNNTGGSGSNNNINNNINDSCHGYASIVRTYLSRTAISLSRQAFYLSIYDGSIAIL